jgi:hypothetical protein
MEDKTWQKNAASQIVLDSIFAALSAVWVTIALGEDPRKDIHTLLKFVEVVCALFSFFLFAISAEGSTNAYEEKDVVKFVYYLLWYNIGVILIGGAIGLLIYAHFQEHFVNVAGSILWSIPPRILRHSIEMVYFLSFSVLLWRWIHDSCWLLFASKQKFTEYLDELEDRGTPTPEHHRLMRLIFFHRLP